MHRVFGGSEVSTERGKTDSLSFAPPNQVECSSEAKKNCIPEKKSSDVFRRKLGAL